MEPRAIQVYRLRDVLAMFAVSESTISRWVDKGTFPQPIMLGQRTRAWLRSDIETFIGERNAARADDRRTPSGQTRGEAAAA